MEIRRSWDRLISTMGFPTLVRWHLYIESGPTFLNTFSSMKKFKFHSKFHWTVLQTIIFVLYLLQACVQSLQVFCDLDPGSVWLLLGSACAPDDLSPPHAELPHIKVRPPLHGLVLDWSISSVLAMEIPQSCIKPFCILKDCYKSIMYIQC